MSNYFSRLAMRSAHKGVYRQGKSANFSGRSDHKSISELSSIEKHRTKYMDAKKKVPNASSTMLINNYNNEEDVKSNFKGSSVFPKENKLTKKIIINKETIQNNVLLKNEKPVEFNPINNRQTSVIYKPVKVSNKNNNLNFPVSEVPQYITSDGSDEGRKNSITDSKESDKNITINKHADGLVDKISSNKPIDLENTDNKVINKSIEADEDIKSSIGFSDEKLFIKKHLVFSEETTNQYQPKKLYNHIADKLTINDIDQEWIYDVVGESDVKQTGIRKKIDSTTVDVRIGNITIDVHQNITKPVTEIVKPLVHPVFSGASKSLSPDVSFNRYYIRGF